LDPINKAIDVLNSGGVILYQTDTIWGLGCLTDNVDAIKKIYSIKGREFNNKLILILENDLLLKKYVREIPEIVWDIIDQAEFQPTIVYQHAINLPDILIEKDGSIAIRIVKQIELLKRINKPLTATSANISGGLPPKNLKQVAKEILSKVDFILDLPKINCTHQPSSIIKIKTNGEIKIIRK
jgi:L-threonylcarbamoyladenylate synthase